MENQVLLTYIISEWEVSILSPGTKKNSLKLNEINSLFSTGKADEKQGSWKLIVFPNNVHRITWFPVQWRASVDILLSARMTGNSNFIPSKLVFILFCFMFVGKWGALSFLKKKISLWYNLIFQHFLYAFSLYICL